MKEFTLLLTLAFSIVCHGQESKKVTGIGLQVGFTYHSNTLNEDNYLDNRSPSGLVDGRSLVGFDFRVTSQTNKEYLDLVFGSIIEVGADEFLTTSMDYKLNGGGVYFGISPKLGTKNFGLTSLFAVGVFSYKEYYSYYSEATTPVTDIYEKKASFGLGAMSSVGLYARIGPVGIHPQVQGIFSGGNDASFLFYGFVLPLTIQF